MTSEANTARAAQLRTEIGTALDELERMDRNRPSPPEMPPPPAGARYGDPSLEDASEEELAAVAAAIEEWRRDYNIAYAEFVRAHEASDAAQAARTAWTAAGDRIAELATLDPSEETLELGSRWARLRPTGAMPTADQIRAMNPMLVAHGRIIPAYPPTSSAKLCGDDVDASATP